MRLLIPVHLKDNAAPYYIASILHEAIFHGILAEGEALYQSQLAERLSVSPIPLREALRLLEMEGLVNFHGRRGAIVTGLCKEDIQEIYEMVTFLETGLLRLAFPLISPDVIEAAGQILDKMEIQADYIAWREDNRLFHNTLYKPARRFLMLDRLVRLRRQIDRYIRMHMDSMKEESQQQHRRILEAVRAKDLPAALEALTFHLEMSSKDLQSYIKMTRTTQESFSFSLTPLKL